jgi:hypothetical protein
MVIAGFGVPFRLANVATVFLAKTEVIVPASIERALTA